MSLYDYGKNQNQFFDPKNFNGTTPNYAGVANDQANYNQWQAQQQNWMNNPNQVGPTGSRTMTQDPNTGQYTVTTSLSPDMQKQFDAQNGVNLSMTQKAGSLVNGPSLSYSGVSPMASFDTSGVQNIPTFDNSGIPGMPQADYNNLAQTRDAVYNQQTQYLDPQFQNQKSDLDVQLANQGIMPGSAAYDREQNTYSLQKQKAYSDARNSAIAAGGAEQSRLFGIGLQARQQGENESLDKFNTGLQAHQQGMNDALARFNTSLQSRQQGVSEANTLHASPINDLAALRGGSQVSMPTFQGGTGTSIPGTSFMDAAQMGFNANLGNENADAANRANMYGGLFGLGSAAIQSGALNGLGSKIAGYFA